ncbi:disks large-associated family protein [Stenotrophomonas mori]|uniref:Disks large-associated family protein n=1 Tax=Stenotrophomonas mori TaxID=2871096 RepID=A0ABT0SIA4_9GAMM|nr:disks large-associated family protein [Stenotrophomonas mori]MCL7714982.1 disks large-associated family protein [Stenotrophomonas mori]
MKTPPPRTPDGRYLVVRGRLWRMADPRLPDAQRQQAVRALMAARRAVGLARRRGDREALARAGAAVDAAKRQLGERGPVWWDDGAPDYNRHLARNTPYAAWYAGLAVDAATGRGS